MFGVLRTTSERIERRNRSEDRRPLSCATSCAVLYEVSGSVFRVPCLDLNDALRSVCLV